MDDDGYVVLPSLLPPSQVKAIRDALSPYLQRKLMGRNDFEGYESERVYALLAKSPVSASWLRTRWCSTSANTSSAPTSCSVRAWRSTPTRAKTHSRCTLTTASTTCRARVPRTAWALPGDRRIHRRQRPHRDHPRQPHVGRRRADGGPPSTTPSSTADGSRSKITPISNK